MDAYTTVKEEYLLSKTSSQEWYTWYSVVNKIIHFVFFLLKSPIAHVWIVQSFDIAKSFKSY